MTEKVKPLFVCLFVFKCFYRLHHLIFVQLHPSGEELEFEYEDKGRGSWLCRIK